MARKRKTPELPRRSYPVDRGRQWREDRGDVRYAHKSDFLNFSLWHFDRCLDKERVVSLLGTTDIVVEVTPANWIYIRRPGAWDQEQNITRLG